MKPRIAILLLLAVGCRPRSPEEPGVPDDIAAIENALQDNAARLQAEGLAVGVREAPPTTTVPEPAPTEQAAEEDQNGPPAAPPADDREVSVQSAPKASDGRGDRGDAARSRSQRICELASATCELAERVCGLAARHGDDPRYADACARAEQQCDTASDACHAG